MRDLWIKMEAASFPGPTLAALNLFAEGLTSSGITSNPWIIW